MGKTTLTNILRDDYKLYVIDCDILARRIVKVGKPAYKNILAIFGMTFQDPITKEIKREALGQLIFSNPSMRRKLNLITGFYITIEIIKEIWSCMKSKQQLIVLDAPLLFESRYLEYLCFPIIVVYMRDQNFQIQRIIARDKITETEALNKIKSQWPIEIKIKKGDILIQNEGSKEDLKSELIKKLVPYII